MEFIAPPLNTVLFLKLKMSNGLSMRGALNEYLISESDEFRNELYKWYRGYEQNQNHEYHSKSLFRKQIVEVIMRGLRGEPVAEIIEGLEREMIEVSKEDVQAHLDRLPSIMLIPLMVFQLPGFLLILIGPIFTQLFKTFGVQ